MEKINLLIADDQILFADSLKMVLTAKCSDIGSIWVAHNGKEAYDTAIDKKPDII